MWVGVGKVGVHQLIGRQQQLDWEGGPRIGVTRGWQGRLGSREATTQLMETDQGTCGGM